MKLKEKLANEKAPWADGNGSNVLYKRGFIDGFEKAREMSARLIMMSFLNPRYTDKTWGEAIELIQKDILNLGEEEID